MDTKDPISEAVAIDLTSTTIEATGMFTQALLTWKDKPENEQTLATFMAHFDKANKERIRTLTTKTAGYHSANQATPHIPTPAPKPTNRSGSKMQPDGGETMYY